ncbi:methyltransferase domain-containing protein [Algoriphagus kandeliae]|uniref:tRNA1(Val) (adenine(37)-N6)-methyltransferase n=1 Tax=Algoriphagus kandeliae TaxID=2562278 RepID=A0A4Y9QMT7_9BACT|nr:methyltransferase [Algoriphagus kandeliae]TFV93507.1 methyltransferase domain-containing protein [Algoriphagus kandeliae]
MGNSWFQFQQFRIEQDRCGMKVSTDAVLLGSLANHSNPKTILDIGTGTGVIALMLAQRYKNAQFIAVELDQDAADQAFGNFASSPFSERLKLLEGKIQEFLSEKLFDLIVSNPPYFTDHLLPQDQQRQRALHTDDLSFSELGRVVDRLLAIEGEFWVILPIHEMEKLNQFFESLQIFPFKSILIQDRPGKNPHRKINAFKRGKQDITEESICLKEEKGGFSDTYRKLISGFLLGY